MLRTAVDLTSYIVAAGEPFLLEVQLQESNGAVSNLAARAFVLSFYAAGRSLVDAIDGELLNDATGQFLRFARDGRFTDALYGQDLTVEFAERYRNGRNVISSGKLTLLQSAGEVVSFDNGVTGQFVVRITMKANASALGTLTPSQQILPFQADLGTPAPAFTSQPSISRSGSRLTGNDGVITNGVAKTREWLLNGTAIATGTIYDLVGTEDGAIVYRVLAEGAGGTLRVSSQPIAVTASPAPTPTPTPTAATLTMTQLATADRIYQRDSETGGAPNKGLGKIAVPLNVTSAGAVYARCRNAEDGTTILQARFLAAENVPVGNGPVTLSGIEARLGWFYVDVQNSDGTWALGTTRVGMGGIMAAVSAQSLLVRMIRPVGGQTIAQQGLTPPKFGRVYATWSGENDDMFSPVWTMPADGALYAGAGMVQILNRLIALYGVNFGFVGHAWGGSRSANFGVLGQGNTYVRNILSAVGGFELMLTFIGHTDSIDDTPQWKLRSNLSGAFDTGVGLNSRERRFRLVSMTIPTGTATSGWGTATAQNHIRRITYDWATKEAGAECRGGVYAQMTGLTTSDGVHPDNQGGARLADCIVDALINGSNTEDGTLPALPMVAVAASYPAAKTYAAGKVFGQALVGGGVQFEPCLTSTTGVNSAAAWVYLTSYQDGAMIFGDNNARYYLNGRGGIYQNQNPASPDGTLPLNRWFQLVYTKIAIDPLDRIKQNAFQIWVDGTKVLEEFYDGLTNSPTQFMDPPTAIGMQIGAGAVAWTDGVKFGPYLLANKHLRGIIPANVTGQEPRIVAFADLNGQVVGQR